jgi:hypothetical protein
MNNSDFVTVREAVPIRGCGLSRLYNLIWSGKLEGAVKGPNGEWGIPRASLERKRPVRS